MGRFSSLGDKGTGGDQSQSAPPEEQARRSRDRERALAGALDRLGRAPAPPAPAILAQTTHVGTYPAAPRAAYAVVAVGQSGTEEEGAAVTYAATGDPFLATNLGSAVPPEGTVVRVDRPEGQGRHTFIYNGA